MSFVLTTCYPFLSSSTITYSPVLMLFPTCSHGVTIFYHMLTCPSSRIVSYCLHLTHRLLLIAMSSGQISGIGLPFILIMSNPCISKLCIRLSNQPIQQETPRVRLDFLLAPKFRRSKVTEEIIITSIVPVERPSLRVCPNIEVGGWVGITCAAFVHHAAVVTRLRLTSYTLVFHHLTFASMSHISHLNVDPDLELGCPSGAPSTIPAQCPL